MKPLKIAFCCHKMNLCIFPVNRVEMYDVATEITLLALCLYYKLVIIHGFSSKHSQKKYISTSVKTNLKMSQYQLSSPRVL